MHVLYMTEKKKKKKALKVISTSFRAHSLKIHKKKLREKASKEE